MFFNKEHLYRVLMVKLFTFRIKFYRSKFLSFACRFCILSYIPLILWCFLWLFCFKVLNYVFCNIFIFMKFFDFFFIFIPNNYNFNFNLYLTCYIQQFKIFNEWWEDKFLVYKWFWFILSFFDALSNYVFFSKFMSRSVYFFMIWSCGFYGFSN